MPNALIPQNGDPLEAAGLLTREAAADLASCHPRTISRAVKRGELSVVRISDAPTSPYLLQRAEVERFAANEHERQRRGGRPPRSARIDIDKLRRHLEQLEEHAHAVRELVAGALS